MDGVLDSNDFENKMILLVFPSEGDKLSFLNDNVIVKDGDGKIKYQSTCYRLFAIFIVGHTTLTTGLVERARKFGFAIALFSMSFRLYEIIGSRKDSNVILHRLQHAYKSLDLARWITKNKIDNQAALLCAERNKTYSQQQALRLLGKYCCEVAECETLNQLMGVEGSASRVFFVNHFDNVKWCGRKPRIKSDYVNSILDIGYTVLFAYVDTLLNIFGFDTYCGVMHTAFYMRKSLTCDVMEPFRCIVDKQTKKSLNLGQFKATDFMCQNGRYDLSWSVSPQYVSVFLKAILERKSEIFRYIQSFYRAFMREKPIENYPTFKM